MNDSAPEKLPDIIKEVTFKAPIEKVWDAVATSEGLAAWCMPNDFKPEAGHKFHLQSPFGPVPCEVTEVQPPNRLSFTWDNFGWQVSFELRPADGGTSFKLVHGGWGAPDEIILRTGQPQRVVHEIMSNGWEPMVKENLRGLLEG